MVRAWQGRGFNFGDVAHPLDLMVPEAIRKKLEPMGHDGMFFSLHRMGLFALMSFWVVYSFFLLVLINLISSLY